MHHRVEGFRLLARACNLAAPMSRKRLSENTCMTQISYVAVKVSLN